MTCNVPLDLRGRDPVSQEFILLKEAARLEQNSRDPRWQVKSEGPATKLAKATPACTEFA